MRILYAVQGTGNGHLSRARQVVALLRESARVQVLVSGRGPDRLIADSDLGQPWFRRGLGLVISDGRIDGWRSARSLQWRRFAADVAALPVGDFDLVVSDFEPVAAWAARRRGVPLIGLGHQYGLRGDAPLGAARWRPSHWFLRAVLAGYAPVPRALGLHWRPYAPAVAPPMVPPGLRSSGSDGPVVVYLPWESPARIEAVLRHLGEHNFINYHPALGDRRVGRIEHRALDRHGFERDLCAARAVICNAGFELISECLQLGKAIWCKPIAGQGEQLANAAALAREGLAAVGEVLDHRALAAWLAALPQPTPAAYPAVARAFAESLLAGPDGDLSALAAALWARTGAQPGGTRGAPIPPAAAPLGNG